MLPPVRPWFSVQALARLVQWQASSASWAARSGSRRRWRQQRRGPVTVGATERRYCCEFCATSPYSVYVTARAQAHSPIYPFRRHTSDACAVAVQRRDDDASAEVGASAALSSGHYRHKRGQPRRLRKRTGYPSHLQSISCVMPFASPSCVAGVTRRWWL
jgi:hypothetical protein